MVSRRVIGGACASALVGVALVSVHTETTLAQDVARTIVEGRGKTLEAAEEDAVRAALARELMLRMGKTEYEAARPGIERASAAARDEVVQGVEVMTSDETDGEVVAVVRVALSTVVLDRLVANFQGDDPRTKPPRERAPTRRPFPDLPEKLSYGGTRLGQFTDDRESDPLVTLSDLRQVTFWRSGDQLVFDFQVGAKFEDGIFAVGELLLDCDRNAATGDGRGFEFGVNSAVGSRLRPMQFVPEDGLPLPIDLFRAGRKLALNLDASRKVRSLTWSGALDPPERYSDGLRTRFPLASLKEFGDRYGGGLSFEFSLETSCTEHPLVFDYVASGEGLPIEIDGATDEWSGGPWVEDAPDELHELFGHLDVVAVWADHGPEQVFVRVDFAEPGFGGTPPSERDVSVYDGVTIDIIPLAPHYMEPVSVTVYSCPARRASGDVTARWSGRTLEAAIPRSPNQSRYRVAVRSGARRRDLLGTGSTPLELR